MHFKLQSVILIIAVISLVQRDKVEGSAIRNGNSKLQNVELAENSNNIVGSDSVFQYLLSFVLKMLNLIEKDNVESELNLTGTIQNEINTDHPLIDNDVATRATTATTSPLNTTKTLPPTSKLVTMIQKKHQIIKSTISFQNTPQILTC